MKTRFFTLALGLALFSGSCKTREFNQASVETAQSSIVPSTGTMRKLGAPQGDTGKVVVYIHGRASSNTEVEPFLKQTDWVSQWNNAGFEVYAYEWILNSFDQDTEPDSAEKKMWSTNVEDATKKVLTLLKEYWIANKLEKHVSELRIVGHSLGSQIAAAAASAVANGAKLEKLSRNSDQPVQPIFPDTLRLELLDPYAGRQEGLQAYQKLEKNLCALKDSADYPPAVVYAAWTAALFTANLGKCAHMQWMHDQWLEQPSLPVPPPLRVSLEDNTLARQHVLIKWAYFYSMNDASPVLVGNAQGFSAALPTSVLQSRTELLALEQQGDLGSWRLSDAIFGTKESALPLGAALPKPESETTRNNQAKYDAQPQQDCSAQKCSDAPSTTQSEIEKELNELKAEQAKKASSAPLDWSKETKETLDTKRLWNLGIDSCLGPKDKTTLAYAYRCLGFTWPSAAPVTPKEIRERRTLWVSKLHDDRLRSDPWFASLPPELKAKVANVSSQIVGCLNSSYDLLTM